MEPLTYSIILTLEELWLMRSVVRHESLDQGKWENPVTSLDLNDRIADTILRCEDHGLPEAAFQLTYRDCLALDALIPQEAKDSKGNKLGKPLLLKTFRARRAIAERHESPEETAEPDIDAGKAEVAELMKEFEATYKSKRPRKAKGST